MTAPSAVEIFDSLHDMLHLFRTRTRNHIELLHPELTLNEMRVLMHTGRNAGITQKELIARSHTDKAQMARILAGLESRDLLERIPSDSDKRVRCLRLSAQGGELFAQLRDLQHQVGSELLKNLPMNVQKQLLRAFQQTCREAS
ncbi:MAG: MarR family transcriptional regulator [Burkholderiaceae bacterium]|nr:MarR family transcriptional regulator [Burkholderiaceae bacterium]